MDSVITARHCEISETLRVRALSVVERIGSYTDRPMETSVVFDTDAGQHRVELRMHVAQGELLMATGVGADHRSALDQAEAKLRRQVQRASGRARRERHSAADLKQI